MNSMKKWKVMLCSGNFELGEVEIKQGIFQGDSLSLLVFVLALIPLSLILRKANTAFEFSESKEKINYLLLMDDLKLYSRSEKRLDSCSYHLSPASKLHFVASFQCTIFPSLSCLSVLLLCKFTTNCGSLPLTT